MSTCIKLQMIQQIHLGEVTEVKHESSVYPQKIQKVVNSNEKKYIPRFKRAGPEMREE